MPLSHSVSKEIARALSYYLQKPGRHVHIRRKDEYLCVENDVSISDPALLIGVVYVRTKGRLLRSLAFMTQCWEKDMLFAESFDIKLID